MPTDLLRLILAACEATVLPSLAVTCKLIEETTSHRRSLLAMLIADPFNVGDIHCKTHLSLGRKNLNDTHLTTFAGACASGALHNVTVRQHRSASFPMRGDLEYELCVPCAMCRTFDYTTTKSATWA